MFTKKEQISQAKQQVIDDFGQHVSSGKAAFFEKYKMQFVTGMRSDCYLQDMDGKQKLFNLHCNGGVFNLGHRNPEISAVLKSAIDTCDIGNHHLLSQYRAKLSSQIVETMPKNLNSVVFGVSGGEAVDLAIKLARGHTKRQKIVSVFGGYHGHTGLSVQAGDEKYRQPFNLHAEGFVQVPFNDFDAMEIELDENTAALIIETIPATLGMLMPESNYLESIRKWCDKRGILMILDEVQTGWGRTGKLWGFEHYNIEPDMVVLGKGMSGGFYPISATVISEPLKSIFEQEPFSHVSTFGGSELGCIVASKVLQLSSSKAFLSHVNALADEFSNQLLLLKQPPMIGFRQKGLMMALEMESEMAGPALTKTAYDQGLLMIYANNRPSSVQFLPPLIMRLDEIPGIINRLIKALKQARLLVPLLTAKDKLGF